MRILFFISTFLVLSCSTEPIKNSTVEAKVIEESSIEPLLYHSWSDHKDTSHQIIFTNKTWIDVYNGDTISNNPIQFFSDYPDKGGKPNLSGPVMALEESPGNYYYFKIELLDSLNLVLDFVTAGSKYQLYRKFNSSAEHELIDQDSIE